MCTAMKRVMKINEGVKLGGICPVTQMWIRLPDRVMMGTSGVLKRHESNKFDDSTTESEETLSQIRCYIKRSHPLLLRA